MPSTITIASSPALRLPDAFGVPVMITSPGSSVENDEIAAICSGMPWIRFAVVPLAALTVRPLSLNEIFALAQSMSSRVTIHGPSGQDVSKPLARVHMGSMPCRSRNVTSLTQVKPST